MKWVDENAVASEDDFQRDEDDDDDETDFDDEESIETGSDDN